MTEKFHPDSPEFKRLTYFSELIQSGQIILFAIGSLALADKLGPDLKIFNSLFLAGSGFFGSCAGAINDILIKYWDRYK